MKRKRRHSLFIGALSGFALFGLPACLLTFAVWSMNLPSNLGVLLPEGTLIIEHTDTHQGIFRREGIATVVVRIPPDSIQEFGEQLREESFSEGSPVGPAWQLLETVEGAKDLLCSGNTLWTYRDEALAFVEEPFSDCFATVFDLETGICCYVEYDS